jgi:proteasome lid subunit RPN8/RPN11
MELQIPRELVNGIMELARGRHPNETILLLRGKMNKNNIEITESILPPFGVGGKGFATFRTSMLPFDLTLVGTLHSHPSGRLSPSVGDLHNFFGKVMVIIGPPYKCENLIAYNKSGEKITVNLT